MLPYFRAYFFTIKSSMIFIYIIENYMILHSMVDYKAY